MCTEGGTEASVCRQCSPLPLPQQVLRASADSVKDCSSSGDRFSAPEMHCKRNTCLQAFARTSQSLSSHNPVRYCTWGACGIHNRSCSQKTSPQAPKWGQQLSPPPPPLPLLSRQHERTDIHNNREQMVSNNSHHHLFHSANAHLP